MNRVDNVPYIKLIESRLREGAVLSDFKAIISELVEAQGFSDFHLGSIKRSPDILDFTLSSVPPIMPEYYNEFELYKYDLAVQCLYGSNWNPIFQSTIDDHVSSAPYVTNDLSANSCIRKLLNEVQFYDCVILPVPNHLCNRFHHSNNSPSKGFFALYDKGLSSPDFILKVNRKSADLQLLTNKLYLFASTHFPEFI